MLFAATACERWAPDNPVEGMAVLDGAHRTAPCEACHDVNVAFTAVVLTCDGPLVLPGTGGTGDTGTPVAWAEQCGSCHECNRPLAGDVVCGETIAAPHYGTTSCGTSGCHAFVDFSWDEGGKCDGGQISTCQSCHDAQLGGSHGNDGAPDTASHPAHLGTVMDDPYTCDTCHPDGGQGAVTHENNAVDVLVDAGTFEPVAKTCTVSCHGESPDGGVTPALLTYSKPVALPVWDQPLPAGCAGCHGSPPPLPPVGTHPDVGTCAGCHAPTGGADLAAVADPGTHLDGTFQCITYGCP
jgi:predicted CxxxxCH...CXXCH cytochrome family protein